MEENGRQNEDEGKEELDSHRQKRHICLDSSDMGFDHSEATAKDGGPVPSTSSKDYLQDESKKVQFSAGTVKHVFKFAKFFQVNKNSKKIDRTQLILLHRMRIPRVERLPWFVENGKRFSKILDTKRNNTIEAVKKRLKSK